VASVSLWWSIDGVEQAPRSCPRAPAPGRPGHASGGRPPDQRGPLLAGRPQAGFLEPGRGELLPDGADLPGQIGARRFQGADQVGGAREPPAGRPSAR